MTTNYYQKHKEKLRKEARERYQIRQNAKKRLEKDMNKKKDVIGIFLRNKRRN